jgi:hypothetical protein
MEFNENTDHSISLAEAAAMTKKFRQGAGQGAIIASAFNKKTLLDILNQEKCLGIRMYYAKKENGESTLVLVGFEENGDDIYDGELAEWAGNCPPNCGASNPLNS